jgi:NADH-quinone oxidoreductase subunit M
MVKRVVYGEVANDNVAALRDIGRREFLILAILAVSVLLLGLWPAPLVAMMDATIGELVLKVSQGKL